MSDSTTDTQQSTWLKAAWDNAAAAHIAIDAQTLAIRDVNKAASDMTGYAADQLIGRPFADVFEAISAEQLSLYLKFGKKPHNMNVRRKSGALSEVVLTELTPKPASGVRVFTFSDQAQVYASDKMRRLSWAVHAYTQSMSALTNTQDLPSLVNNVCEAIVSNGVYVLAWFGLAESGPNKPVRMLGCAGEALEYMKGLEISWSADAPGGQGPTGMAIRSGQPYIMRDALVDPTFQSWREKGQKYGIRSSVTIPFKRSETVRGALMVYANSPNAFGLDELELFARLCDEVGFAVEAEHRSAMLAMTEAKFERLISATPTPVIGVGMDNIIQIYNTVAEQVFGYTQSEAIGQPLDILIPLESISGHRKLLQTYGLTEKASRKMAPTPVRELVGRKKNGETFPIEVIISKIDTADGSLMTAIVRDLTEQKAIQRRLMQSEKMEAFGQLAGGIAHDFNNLLGVISGNAELIREKNGMQPQYRANLDFIESACAHGADLTRRLLVFSRKADPKLTTVDICAVVHEVSAILRYTLNGNISVETRITDDSAYVNADASMLQTSLLNLCLNARDAMPDGGTLTLTVDRIANSGAATDFVAIAIADTGTGIPPHVLPQIFDPFFTTKPEGKGTGLGLSMVYGFAEQCGGKVEVKSELGQGTCFTLTLPCATAPVAPTTAVVRGVVDLREITILYVEDNEDLRDVSAMRLEMLGAHVIAVGTPDEALEISASAEHIHILLTDLQLSHHMSGISLAHELRRRRPNIGIAITTGYLHPQDAKQLEPDWAVLEKPVTHDALISAISRLVTPSELRASAS